MNRALLMRQLGRLWRQLEPGRRRQLLVAAALLVVSGLLEMLSLGLVLPLLLTLLRWSGGPGFGVVALFCGAALASGAVRLATLWLNSRLAAAVGSDLAERAWRETLLLPYRELLQLDHSRIVAMLAPQLRQLIQLVLLQALHVVSAAVLTSGIVVMLLGLAWQVALPALMVLALSYALLSRVSRGPLQRNGDAAAADQQQLIRQLHDNLADSRERLLRSNALVLAERYGAIDRRMRRREADNVVLTGLPRFLLEPLGMVTIALVGLALLTKGQPVDSVLPLLGVMAFAAQRLLPLSQQLWAGWAAVNANLVLLDPLLPLLERQTPTPPKPVQPLDHWQRCSLAAVDFAYGPAQPAVLRGFGLTITRGEWLGLRGPSGCGKSTVVDLLMGLLQPDAGSVLVDDQPLLPGTERLRRWQAGLAYLGAAVPLTPGTIAANVSQERPLDPPWLAELLHWFELESFQQRHLGEGGRQFSGGQRQRLGLARALYGRPQLLVLDEATSALDLASEQRLFERLRQQCPGLTVLLVSHRDASLAICDRLVTLQPALH